jgi:hypothetical protein
MRHLVFAALAVLPAALPARAAETVFVARTAAGKEISGPLARLDSEWALELGERVRKKVAAGELVELRQKDAVLPPLPIDEHLILASGDRLPFTSMRLDDEKVFLRNPDLGGDEVGIPLSSVLVVWRQGPDRTAAPEKLRRALLAAKRAKDTVLLRNGDRIEGTLNGIGQEVEIEVNKKRQKVKWTQVAAIAMSTELADRPKAPPLAGRLTLTATQRASSARLTVTAPSVVKGELRARTTFGAIVRVPLERVAAIEMVGGRVVPLSSLKPSKYEYRPYLDEKFNYALDASVMGRDLRVGGSGYEHGVSMHAHSLLTYELDGKQERFEALVGLDDVDGRKGSVKVRVLLDGKEVDLGQKGDLSRKVGPWRVSVPLASAKTLTLEVLLGDNGPVQAVVNWVDARLIREK